MDINLKDFTIKRYTIRPQNEHEDSYLEMWMQVDEDETGDWVKHEDLQPLLARLEHLEKQLSLCALKVIKAREVLS
jgi:hypothetical protein